MYSNNDNIFFLKKTKPNLRVNNLLTKKKKREEEKYFYFNSEKCKHVTITNMITSTNFCRASTVISFTTICL